MADDLPIKITLDPGPAAAGAKKVTDEVKKTEEAGKKATNAYADFQKQLARIEVDAGKAAKAVSSINFKQAASGAWQAFTKINSELGLMDSKLGRVVGRSVEWGATGAQIAGPWGAAIGAVAGGLTSLVKGITDAEAATRKLREEAERQAKEYWEGVKAAEMKARVERELAPELEKHARLAKEVSEREATLKSVMDAQVDTYRKATDRALAYADQLYKVNAALAIQIAMNEKLYGKDPTAGGPQSADQSASVIGERGMRDATIESYAADKSYGATLIDLANAENKRVDKLRDLEQILGDINVSEEVRKRAFQEYDELSKKKTAAIDAETAALRKLIEEERRRRNVLGTMDGRTQMGSFPSAYTGDNFQTAIDIAGARGVNYDAFAAEDNERSLQKAALEAKQFQATVDDLQANSLGALEAQANAVGSALVDAFMTGEFSAKKFFDSLASMALNSLISNLIGFGFAQLGPTPKVPGLATGGYLPPSGSGSTDSQFVAFRKSPWESVHVNTPGQESTMRSSSGGSVKIVNQMQDRRALLQSMSDDPDFARTVLNVVREYSGAVSSLLPR
jgi:hypothetical protein